MAAALLWSPRSPRTGARAGVAAAGPPGRAGTPRSRGGTAATPGTAPCTRPSSPRSQRRVVPPVALAPCRSPAGRWERAAASCRAAAGRSGECAPLAAARRAAAWRTARCSARVNAEQSHHQERSRGNSLLLQRFENACFGLQRADGRAERLRPLARLFCCSPLLLAAPLQLAHLLADALGSALQLLPLLLPHSLLFALHAPTPPSLAPASSSRAASPRWPSPPPPVASPPRSAPP